MIVRVAVVIDGEIKHMPPPARHHHILQRWPLPYHEQGEQGFIDDELGFLDRKQAWDRVHEIGQTINDINTAPGLLFSEHLW